MQLKWPAIMSFDLEAYADVRWLTFEWIIRVRLDAVAMTIAYFVDALNPNQLLQCLPASNSMVALNSLDKLSVDVIKSLPMRMRERERGGKTNTYEIKIGLNYKNKGENETRNQQQIVECTALTWQSR